MKKQDPAKEYAKYEKAAAKIRGENEKLLAQFEDWLGTSGLSLKVVQGHRSNIDFYVNEYLLYEDAVPAAKGITEVGMYLGYWFIKKAMWASAASIRGNAASLKKFYTFMQEQGHVSQTELQDLKETLKENLPDYLATVERYDDESITDMREVWGL